MMTIVEHRILLPTIEEMGNAVISDVEAAVMARLCVTCPGPGNTRFI